MELEVEKDGVVVAKVVDAVKSVSVIQYSLKVMQLMFGVSYYFFRYSRAGGR
jgi:hypothetical protein